MTRRLPAAERREQIVGAATHVFARRGYRGATTKAIAREAGVAEALLYRHFASKEGLFVAVVERTAARILDGAAEIVSIHRDDPNAAIAAMLGFAKGLLERNETLAKMVFIVNAELDDPAIREAYVPCQDRVLALLTDALTDWQARGLVPRRLPPRAAAWLILGTFEVVALMKLTGRLGELDGPPAIAIVSRVLGSAEAAE